MSETGERTDPAPPPPSGLAEAIAARLHIASDHYRDFGGPLSPDEGSSWLCDCRRKAALAADAVDRHLLAVFTAALGEHPSPAEVEAAVRQRVSDWLSRQADAWEHVAHDPARAGALRWAARAIVECQDGDPEPSPAG